jgi:hypothetical protein
MSEGAQSTTAADKIKQEQGREGEMRHPNHTDSPNAGLRPAFTSGARLASPRTGNVIIGMQYFSPFPFLLFDPGSEGGVTVNVVD